jgi:hypothetical protein
MMRNWAFILLICSFSNSIAQKPIKLTLQIKDVQQTNAFTFKLYRHLFDYNLPDLTTESTKDANGNYIFSAGNISEPVYVTIVENITGISIPLMDLYLVEPGDDIAINVIKDTSFGIQNVFTTSFYHQVMSYGKFKLEFSGKGAAKYQCRYQSGKIVLTTDGDRSAVDSNGNFIAKEYTHNYFDFTEARLKKLLDSYKSKISRNAWDILKIDLFSSLEIERVREVVLALSGKDNVLLKKVKSSYEKRAKTLEASYSESARTFSAVYPQYLLEKILFRRRLLSEDPNFENDLKQIITQINKTYTGELRDKIFTLLGLRLPGASVSENVVNDLLTKMTTDYCIDELSSYADKNFVGRPAYSFALPDSTGKVFKLEDFRGKVVFLDFWFNGCGNCAVYYKTIVSKVETSFHNNPNVVFITINTDKERGDWIEALREGIYTSSKAINLNTGGNDHPIIKNYRAWSAPRPILIGKDGKIFSNDTSELRRSVAKLGQAINDALKSTSGY